MNFEEIQKLQDEINSRPIDDFEGLSATQMRDMIHSPFSKTSVVQFSDSISKDTLLKIPIFNLLTLFLEKVKSNNFSLTKTGNLPPKLVKELYLAGYISEYGIDSGISKLYKEDSSLTIHLIHILSKLCRYVSKRKDKLVVTRVGQTLLEQSVNLIQDFFTNHALQFNHGYFDNYPETNAGASDISYTLFLLNKFGDKPRSTKFYTAKLRIAFPDLLFDFADSQFQEPEEQFDNCIETRILNRFLSLYGFISGYRCVDDFRDEIQIKKTDIFDKFFKISYVP